MDRPMLEFCKSSDPRYQDIRDRHYVPNHGTQGQQLHFIIHYKNQVVGIISAASSVYAVKARDDYFQIPKDIKQRKFKIAIYYENIRKGLIAKYNTIAV